MLRTFSLLALTATLAISFGPSLRADQKDTENTARSHTAIKPAPRDKGWMGRHDKFVEIAKRGDVDLLFLGDSITDAWGGEGHNPKSPGNEIFEKEFKPKKAANFGIGGDRTQHVLWRLQNGEFDTIKPKALMLMIGTNNSNGKDNTAEEIAEGVKLIVREIHKRSPKTKVLLLAVFPRSTGKDPAAREAQTDKINAVNAQIAKLDDGGKTVQFMDIGKKFLAADGSIPKEIMPDQLHLSPKGYRIWADAVTPALDELLK
jgi:lysophospholipase L1-like esterase